MSGLEAYASIRTMHSSISNAQTTKPDFVVESKSQQVGVPGMIGANVPNLAGVEPNSLRVDVKNRPVIVMERLVSATGKTLLMARIE